MESASPENYVAVAAAAFHQSGFVGVKMPQRSCLSALRAPHDSCSGLYFRSAAAGSYVGAFVVAGGSVDVQLVAAGG